MGGNANDEEAKKGVVGDQATEVATTTSTAVAAAAAKDNNDNDDPSSSLLDSLASFRGFVVEEVLNVNDLNKVAAVVGR